MLEKEHLNSFTALRLLGAFCVLFSHSFDLLGEPEPFEELIGIKLSKMGLWIFFSISGYLISYSAIHSKNLLSYLWKRVVRIFPALIVVVVLSIVLVGPIFTTFSILDYFRDSSTLGYLKNIILYRNQYSLPGVFQSNVGGSAVNGSLWTLAYEFSFYIITASLIWLPKSLYRIWGVVLFMVFLGVYSLGVMAPGLTLPFFYLNVESFGEFGILFTMGVCYQLFISKGLSLSFFIETVVYVLITMLLVFHPGALLFFFCPFIIHIGSKKSFFSSLDRYGDVSYGLYLYAFPVQQVLINLFPIINPIELMMMALVLTGLLAYISWIFVEKPSLKLKTIL